MKRVVVIAVVLMLLFNGCCSGIPESAECVLCDVFPKHAPCLVNLNSGEIRELEIYQPHPTKVAELSEEQHSGYMSLVQFGEISGILIGAEYVALEAPTKAAGMLDDLFCEDYRKLLKENKCQGYILADLRNPDTPVVWKIEDGVSFSVRCYDIQISESDETGKLRILMIGTFEIEHLIR